MNEDMQDMILPVIGFVVVVLGIWGIIAAGVGITNAQNQMNWCQYKNGLVFYSQSDIDAGKAGATGKRWSPNPLTAGFTGECINPGDKGL